MTQKAHEDKNTTILRILYKVSHTQKSAARVGHQNIRHGSYVTE